MTILIADDDVDDRTLASIAFDELAVPHEVVFVNDGQELMDYLNAAVKNNKKLPDLILLDLNMPRKDGRVALKEIKANPKLKHIEVNILSTSASEIDMKYTRELGAKKYIVKPTDFNQLVSIFREVCEQLVE